MIRVNLARIAFLAVLASVVFQPAAPAATTASTVGVAFLQGEQLAPVRRAGSNAEDAVRALLAGPTSKERAAGYRTYVPAQTQLRDLTIADGLATVDLSARFAAGQSDERMLASVTQLVRTLSPFSQVDRVALLVEGKPVMRTVDGVALSRPLTLKYLRTPNVPVPKPPAEKRRPPDPEVRDVQGRLIELGYLLKGDQDGRFGPTTSEGILAFQKYERLARTGALNGATREALVSASPPVPVTRGAAGKRAEVLLDKQVALLIKDNEVVRAIAVSTGKASTPTPPGSYKVYAKIPRWWSTPFREWLPWALPFVGGIAFHELGDVPVYPASHGCVRQPYSVARWTYDFADVGMPVRVLAHS
jgi:Sporulation and spore germination/L,D-transpeptidase catalytic domain/Putative peptidoglycan binding domain